jgi:hypothetical protein
MHHRADTVSSGMPAWAHPGLNLWRTSHPARGRVATSTPIVRRTPVRTPARETA